MKKQRICFLINDLFAPGGVSSFVLGLAAEFRRRTYCSIALVAARADVAGLRLPEDYFSDIFTQISAYDRNRDQVVGLLKDDGLVVISLQFDVHLKLQKYISSKAVILMFHGDARELSFGGFYRREFSLLNCFILRNYKFLVLLGEANKVELSRRAHHLLCEKLIAIPNGIDLVGKKNLFALSGKYVYVGRLSHEKNVLELLELFGAPEVNTKFTIDVYGDGPMRESLESLIKQRNLGNVIFLRGHCNDREKIFKGKQGLLLTSFTEGFPMVILEAYKHGIPVFCYDNFTAAKDLVDQHIGCLIPAGNRLEFKNKLISNFVPDREKLTGKLNCYSYDVVAPLWQRLLASDFEIKNYKMRELFTLFFHKYVVYYFYLRITRFFNKFK